jgi:hypothetical protein
LDGATLTLDADASGSDGEHVSDCSTIALPDIASPGMTLTDATLADVVPGAAQDARLATELGTEAGRRLLEAGADVFLVR